MKVRTFPLRITIVALVLALTALVVGSVSAQQSMTLDSAYSGSITANGTVNVDFQTAVGGVYRFALSDLSTDTIEQAGVFSSDGTTEKIGPNRDLVGDGSQVQVRITSTEAGTFTLSAELLGVQEDGGDDLPSNTSTRGLLKVDKKPMQGGLDSGDSDWYKVQLDGHSRYRIQVGSNSTSQTYSGASVAIFDASGNQVLSSEHTVTFLVVGCEGGTYYVQVGNSTNRYTYYVEVARVGNLMPDQAGVSTGVGSVRLEWNCWTDAKFEVVLDDGSGTIHILETDQDEVLYRQLGIGLETRLVGLRWEADLTYLPNSRLFLGRNEYRFNIRTSPHKWQPVRVSVPDENRASPNHGATGIPTIIGTVRQGQTLTVDTSDISDSDGLTNVSYNYQWMETPSGWLTSRDIVGATNSTFVLRNREVLDRILVRVSFRDDAGNFETRISEATQQVGGL